MSTDAQIEVDTRDAQHARLVEETNKNLERAGIKSHEKQTDLEAVNKLAELAGGEPAADQQIYGATTSTNIDAKTVPNEGPTTLHEWADPKKVDLRKPTGIEKFIGEIGATLVSITQGKWRAAQGEQKGRDARGLLAERILEQSEHSGVNYDVAEGKK